VPVQPRGLSHHPYPGHQHPHQQQQEEAVRAAPVMVLPRGCRRISHWSAASPLPLRLDHLTGQLCWGSLTQQQQQQQQLVQAPLLAWPAAAAVVMQGW
jgi:hypothetical protein